MNTRTRYCWASSPQCPIWHDLRNYLEKQEFCWPDIVLLLGEFIDHRCVTPEVSYNETFLALSVAYTCMPSFRRSGIGSFPHVPTLQQKINDLMILIQVAGSSQARCVGCINGKVLEGPKFLAQLAREFGASFSFHPDESPLQGAPKERLFHKTQRWRQTQKDSHRAP